MKSYHENGFKNVSFIATYNSEITFMDTHISILGAKQRLFTSDFIQFKVFSNILK